MKSTQETQCVRPQIQERYAEDAGVWNERQEAHYQQLIQSIATERGAIDSCPEQASQHEVQENHQSFC